MTEDDRCSEYARLQTDVQSVLGKLQEITSAQLEAFRVNDRALFMQLDKELDLTIGEKERKIGALHQHVEEHHCQSD